MEILLNGRKIEVADKTHVLDLLTSLNLKERPVAVQVNEDIVKRDRYESVLLQPEDAVEVLTFAAGG
jgi:sulfur carrier protein